MQTSTREWKTTGASAMPSVAEKNSEFNDRTKALEENAKIMKTTDRR